MSSSTSAPFYLSIKPPALNFNPEFAAAITRTAFQNGHGVHFDAHKFTETDATFQLLDHLLRRNLAAGDGRDNWSFSVTLPSRWQRSRVDARWAVQKGLRVRLVKGDFPADACEELEPASAFLALVDQLAGKVPGLALATHDCALAEEAITRCRRAGGAVELELFFGMPATAMMALASKTRVPVGFYVPYGDTLLVYIMRDLLTNPHKLLRRYSYQVLGSVESKLATITGSAH